MQERQRKLARRRLDEEMRPFMKAGRDKDFTKNLLRVVRQILNVPAEEIATKMKANRSLVFGLEKSERMGTIKLVSMSRMARAMGCKVVYGIVPLNGRTLEELAQTRYWEKVMSEQLEIEE